MPYPAKDGGAIATLSLAKNLCRNGATVDILAMNTSKHNTNYEDIPDEITHTIVISTVEINTEINFFQALGNFFFSSS